ncbi:MAG: bifunctional tetrahydrofolate synthase/dihydrofolate synthase [Gallionella sp.]|jgi:dihydrofolate synthase/folylpolyglutamate synthase|nr:bifunctional tetrahydrofolate synthase/dihydrofolate synthase [Gallionella sp.]
MMDAPRTLGDWLVYLESLHPKTIALGLERVAEVRHQLGLRPEFPIVIVSGTNGKGSVCAMLESILHAAGYRVGCYTSPHLLHYNERVRVARQTVSDAALCTSFQCIEEVRGDVPLTYFEFGTLAAMQTFIARQVDVAILEVGLGGRLDAVNVFDADCAVVTSVDIDHVDYLGDTREKIAFEKAGIFRTGKVAICADAAPPSVLREHAEKIGAAFWRLNETFRYAAHQGQWDFYGVAGARLALPFPALRGAYQLQNASAALAALDALRERLPVGMEAIRRGLVEVSLPGRFQVLPGRPQLILDVAHNPHAARALASNLAALPPVRTLAVFAMLQDKDIDGVVRILDAFIDVWFVGSLSGSRGTCAGQMASLLKDCGVRGEIVVCEEVADALAQACKAAGENDRIAAFGSFHTVAEVMQARGMSLTNFDIRD